MREAVTDQDWSVERFGECRRVLMTGYEDTPADWDAVPGRRDAWMEARDTLCHWPADAWPRPRPGTRPHSVAIVGKASGRYLAPWGEEGWELWGLNESPAGDSGVPPVVVHTRWFQLHPPHYLRVHFPPGIEQLERDWSEPIGVRMYMDRHYDEYPDSEPYPRDEVEALTPHGAYHCSSFDWMLALALLEGFERIRLCGVALHTPPVLDTEPLSARPALEYWAGVAEGRGAVVECVGFAGHLFKTVHLARYVSDLAYGFEREPALDLSLKDDAWEDYR